ncbi:MULTISPECIES: MBL fold metallo-hydrolase [Bacillaceae]|uniref:MBL fold metallo-hydrolase n=1 Tax=Evansella alkalicola TaxID=745819 RepID=A0ABS6JWD1_9BACI|nr:MULTISPECIES: MBL fold metallo-hydrolase [Bacillaceae]MBU9722903.1 MBL fold metallo-hydrolase [Bacillus alkalicola]
MSQVCEVSKDIIKMTLPTPFLVGPVNSYLIKGNALTLVDVGPKTPEALAALKLYLKEQRLQLKDIEVVILTHHHPDHIGLLEEFIPHAKVYAHRKVKPWLNSDTNFLQKTRGFLNGLYRKHGVSEAIISEIERNNKKLLSYSAKGTVDKVLEEGDKLSFLDGWSVIETPGHAQSHISLYREDGLLISGDHLIKHISSNAIIEAPYEDGEERPRTLLQYRQSMEKCMHIDIAYSGHGEAVTDPKTLIKTRLAEQDKKAKQFKSMMGSDPISCFELCKKKYAHIIEKQAALTFSETLGHLDLLEERKEVERVEGDGVLKYRVI